MLLIDEATSFTWPIIDYLLTRNRKTVDHIDFRPFAVFVTNPGNVGHAWYAALFDLIEQKQGPHEQVKKIKNMNGAMSEIYFIPAFIPDNAIGVARDPDYESRLDQRDPIIARALKKGDWTVFSGQAFSTWLRDRIACKPFELPPTWPKWRAVDYGFSHAFSAGWLTRDVDNERIYVYRAVLQSGMTDTRQAVYIRDATTPEELITATYASPDMWAKKNVKNVVTTTADEYRDEGVLLTRADNDRLGGKRKIDRLLIDLVDGRPGIQIFEPYYQLFSCMTALVRDPHDPEDVLKVDGDDAYDMLRYGLTNVKIKGRSGVVDQKRQNPANRYRTMI